MPIIDIIQMLPNMWLQNKKQMIVVALGLVSIGFVTLVPEVNATIEQAAVDDRVVALEIAAMQNTHAAVESLPESENRELPSIVVPVSAYNSVPWQTDATPCIGAQGTDICEKLERGLQTCAANFVPLGTVLEVDGLGTCTVRDRMNARYNYRVDWYMGMDIQAARNWGVRQKNVAILK